METEWMENEGNADKRKVLAEKAETFFVIRVL